MSEQRFDVIKFDDLHLPLQQNNNKYNCFENIIKKNGVYVFQHKITNEVLYIGEAYKQDLKKRIVQNFTEHNTGGTFRKNYCFLNKKNFSDFKQLISESNLQIISINNINGSKVLIHAMEAILISLLQPKYNLDN